MFTHTVYILPAIMLHQDPLTSTTKLATIEEGTPKMWHFPLSQGNNSTTFKCTTLRRRKKKSTMFYQFAPLHFFLSLLSLFFFFNPCIFTISSREFASTIHLQTTSKQTNIAVCSETGGLLSRYHAKNARMLKFVQNFNVKTMRTYTT